MLLVLVVRVLKIPEFMYNLLLTTANFCTDCLKIKL